MGKPIPNVAAPEVVAHLSEAVQRHPALRFVEHTVTEAFALLHDTMRAGGIIYTCGNGGSAADSEHFAAELLKGFEHPRPLTPQESEPLPSDLARSLQRGIRAVPLTGFIGARTAVSNDNGGELEFAQIAHTLMTPSDTLFAISTSGNSRNIVLAAHTAIARGGRVVALCGQGGGELAELADVSICVPATRTLEVQELHLPVYHTLALMLETSLVMSEA